MFKRLLTAVFGAALLAGCGPQGTAEVGPDYFNGKTITYIVATDPGGGYDTYGRLIARYMQKHLPGSRVLVRNVPGAGHIVGANTINAARPDGLTIGMFNTGLIYNQLLQLEGAQFDLAEMSWIGKASNELRVMLVATNSPYKSFEEMLRTTTPIKFAASGVGSAAYLDARILSRVFPEMMVEVIPGYEGSEGELAMLRGEVVAQVGIASSYENFVKAGNGYFALAMSQLAAEDLPGVPLAETYVQSEEGHRLLSLLEALSDLGRLTVGPPGIPEPILAQLRAAHDAAINDPELLAEAETMLIPITPGSGQFVQERIVQALNQPPETIAALAAAAAPQ
jgi:tripartite-type tricarboxylate transporter receptor subunit TctC